VHLLQPRDPAKIEHLNRRTDIKLYLKSISSETLEEWLQKETAGPAGVRILTKSHIAAIS